VVYLAQRSRTAPRYFGLQLDQPGGWRHIDNAIRIIVEGVMRGDGQGPRPRRAGGKRPQRG
jgi:hypothetical protein